jgi:hypothetical protein
MANAEFQKWILRQRALGKKIPISLAQSYLSAELGAKAREARVGDIQTKDIASREKIAAEELALREDIAEKQYGISEKELALGKKRLGLLEEQGIREARAAKTAGLLDIAKTGIMYEIAAKQSGLPSLVGGVKGIAKGLLPETTAAAPVVGEGVGAVTAPTEAVTGAEITTAAPSTLTSVGYGAGAGAIAGYIGKALTKAGRPGHMGGERLTGGTIGGLGGAIAGFAYGGPVGALVGGIFGAFSGSGGTVICTELHRQGYMTDEMLKLDSDFASNVDIETYVGYRKLAEPLVNRMKKSSLITKTIKPFALAWAKEMCHIMKPESYKRNMIGKLIMKIGISICRLKGKSYIAKSKKLYPNLKYIDVPVNDYKEIRRWVY